MSRPSSIDPTKQAQVCTLLSAGHSYRDAARYVGCSPSAISYWSKHNPDFRQQLLNAELAAKTLSLEAIRAAAGKSWRAAVWLHDKTDEHHRPGPRRSAASCIDPRRICKRLYNRILGLIADPNTRCAVREAFRDTYHTVGLKPPARDPELRKKPLPVYPADADHWDLQDYSPADEDDRRLARALESRPQPAATLESRLQPVPAAPPLSQPAASSLESRLQPEVPSSKSPTSSICKLKSPAPPPQPAASSLESRLQPESPTVPLPHPPAESPPLPHSPSPTLIDTPAAPASPAPTSPESPPTHADLLPYRMQAILSGMNDPDYIKLMISELPRCKTHSDIVRKVRERIAGNLSTGRAPLARGKRRKQRKLQPQ